MGTVRAILRQPIRSLGNAGDIVSVKRGFFRYLKDLDKVQYATKENMQELEQNIEDLKAEDEKRRLQAEKWAKDLTSLTLSFDEEGSDSGVLYGSVTARHICRSIKENNIPVSPGQVRMDKPLKDCGEYDIVIDLHPRVQAHLKVVVGIKNSFTGPA